MRRQGREASISLAGNLVSPCRSQALNGLTRDHCRVIGIAPTRLRELAEVVTLQEVRHPLVRQAERKRRISVLVVDRQRVEIVDR